MLPKDEKEKERKERLKIVRIECYFASGEISLAEKTLSTRFYMKFSDFFQN